VSSGICSEKYTAKGSGPYIFEIEFIKLTWIYSY